METISHEVLKVSISKIELKKYELDIIFKSSSGQWLTLPTMNRLKVSRKCLKVSNGVLQRLKIH